MSRHADDLARAAHTLLPDGSLDVICYGCTSGSLVIGETRVAEELSKGAPKARATSLIAAVIAALRALKVARVAVATPYLDEINEQERLYLESAGFKVTNIQGLQLEKDSDMIRVRPIIWSSLRARSTRLSQRRFSSAAGRLGRSTSLKSWNKSWESR